MPILFMALIGLAIFMAMGLMLFYAAYVETKAAHARGEHTPEDLHRELHPELLFYAAKDPHRDLHPEFKAHAPTA